MFRNFPRCTPGTCGNRAGRYDPASSAKCISGEIGLLCCPYADYAEVSWGKRICSDGSRRSICRISASKSPPQKNSVRDIKPLTLIQSQFLVCAPLLSGILKIFSSSKLFSMECSMLFLHSTPLNLILKKLYVRSCPKLLPILSRYELPHYIPKFCCFFYYCSALLP